MNQMIAHPVHQFTAADQRLLATFDREGAVIHLFEPIVDRKALTFTSADETTMTDSETGSRWEIVNGTCTKGTLKGKTLTPVVGIMSFRTAWNKFHPDSSEIPF